MSDLISGGSPFFMGLLSIVGAILLIYAGLCLKPLLNHEERDRTLSKVKMIREIGLFALILAVLSITTDLLMAFGAIEEAGAISMGLLAGGLKYSLVALVYGLIIYLISLLIWLVMKWQLDRKLRAEAG